MICVALCFSLPNCGISLRVYSIAYQPLTTMETLKIPIGTKPFVGLSLNPNLGHNISVYIGTWLELPKYFSTRNGTVVVHELSG